MVIDRVFTYMKAKNGGAPVTRSDLRSHASTCASNCGFTRDRDEVRDLLRQIAKNTARE